MIGLSLGSIIGSYFGPSEKHLKFTVHPLLVVLGLVVLVLVVLVLVVLVLEVLVLVALLLVV